MIQGLEALQVRTYKKGDIIFKENDPADLGVGFLLSGILGTYKQKKTLEMINMIQPNQFFGEIGVILNAPRSATLMVETDIAKVIFLNQELFIKKAQRTPKLVASLLRICYSRIVEVEKQILQGRAIIKMEIPNSVKGEMKTIRQKNLEIANYIKHAYKRVVLRASKLYDEGDSYGNFISLVLRGEFFIYRKFGNEDSEIGKLEIGDMFGHPAEEVSSVRMFSVRTKDEESEVMNIGDDIFMKILQLDASLAFNYFKTVIIRLISLEEALRKSLTTVN